MTRKPLDQGLSPLDLFVPHRKHPALQVGTWSVAVFTLENHDWTPAFGAAQDKCDRIMILPSSWGAEAVQQEMVMPCFGQSLRIALVGPDGDAERAAVEAIRYDPDAVIVRRNSVSAALIEKMRMSGHIVLILWDEGA